MRGLMNKRDQIRPHLLENPRAFTVEEQKKILALYVPQEKFAAQISKDAASYQKAVTLTGVPLTRTEPIVEAALRFEEALDLKQVCAELWITEEQFIERLRAFPTLARSLGALRTKGGTIQREVFVRRFDELIARLRVAKAVPGSLINRASQELQPVAPTRVKLYRGNAFERDLIDLGKKDGKRVTGRLYPVIDPGFNRIAILKGSDVEVFELSTGKVEKVLKGPKGAFIRSLALSREGTYLAVGGPGVHVWNLRTGQLKSTLLQKTNAAVWTSTFLPGGKQLLASHGRNVVLLDVATGKVLSSFRSSVGNAVFALETTPDGKKVVTTGGPWNRAPAIPFREILAPQKRAQLTGHLQSALDFAFTPDGKKLISTGLDGTICLWDVETSELLGSEHLLTSDKIPAAVHAVSFSTFGKYAATAHDDGCITLWEMPTFRHLITFKGHVSGLLQDVTFSEDGIKLASQARDGVVKIWDLEKLLQQARKD